MDNKDFNLYGFCYSLNINFIFFYVICESNFFKNYLYLLI